MAITIESPRFHLKPTSSSGKIANWVVMVALGLAYLPLLWQHAHQLWLRPHYQFFPLAILAALWLAYWRGRGLGQLSPGRTGTVSIGLLICLLILAAGIALDSSWLAAVSFPPMLATLAYAVGGWSFLRQMLPALVLLSITIPPPLELDRNLILALQRKTTSWSSSFLDLLGIFHLMSGNVVEVDGQQLFVDEACSGINSLFVIGACTLFVIFHERRPVVWSILLMISAVGWVLLCNMLRVLLLTILKVRFAIDLTTGWKHDAFGFLLFALALILIWSTDRLLRFLFLSSEPSLAPVPETNEEPTRFPPRALSQSSWVLVVPALALAAIQVESISAQRVAIGSPAPSPALQQANAETLPARWARWERGDFATKTRNPGSYFGEVSKMWSYRLGKNAAIFSLDYPFPHWHDLTRCYTGQGWAVVSETVHPPQESQAGFVEVVLSRPGSQDGYLLFSQFDGRGLALQPRLGGAGLSIFRHGLTLERWRKRLLGESSQARGEIPPVYQAQLFVETYTPLQLVEQQHAQAFFHDAVSRVTRNLIH